MTLFHLVFSLFVEWTHPLPDEKHVIISVGRSVRPGTVSASPGSVTDGAAPHCECMFGTDTKSSSADSVDVLLPYSALTPGQEHENPTWESFLQLQRDQVHV